jgi:uroporphyrinogen-III synthase
MVRMLVTRPEPDAGDTAARLRALAIEPVVAPLLEFELLETVLPDATGFAGLAITSANALRALQQRGEVGRLRHLPVYCVGERTADAARQLGFAHVASAAGDSRDLVAAIAAAGLAGPLLYPAARERAADLGRALAPHGLMVITAAVYAMTPIGALPPAVRAELEAGSLDAALFYSRRTAAAFAALCAGLGARSRIGMLCLSEAVAAPLLAAHFVRVALADHPSEEAMMALALSFARDQNPA